MSYTKITELIKKWEEYENLYPEATMTGFGEWLSTYVPKESLPVNAQKKNQNFHKQWDSFEFGLKDHHRDKEREVQISMLMGRLGRYGRLYSKKSLSSLNINLEEFTFLSSIFRMKNPRKSDVIMINLFEPTSGTEILRRLIKLNFVKESASKEDKRSKLLKLTPQGEKTLFKAFECMGNVSQLITANLTEAQKTELIPVLDYLNDFHAHIYLNHKDDEIQTIIKQYIGNKKI